MRLFFSCCLLGVLVGCATVEPTVVTDPQSYRKEAERLYAKGNYEEAIGQWKRFKESDLPAEEIIAVSLKIADTQYESGNYIEAAASYEEFRKLHPTHEKAGYALYRIGLCYFQQITGIDTDQTPVKNAVQHLEAFLRQYPGTPYEADAKAKLEECRKKMVQHEVYVARFYYRTDKYQAAIKRLEETLKAFPQSPVHDETLYYLGAACMEAGQVARGKEAFNRLLTEFPASPYVKDATKMMEKYR